MDCINGDAVEQKLEGEAVADNSAKDVLLNNSNKPVNTKLLKKSQSENLDLMNKNVRSINGDTENVEVGGVY